MKLVLISIVGIILNIIIAAVEGLVFTGISILLNIDISFNQLFFAILFVKFILNTPIKPEKWKP